MYRKFLGVLLASAAVMMLSGCAGGPFSTGPSGTWPAFVYSDQLTYPSANFSSTQYQLTTDDFEIRGTVVARGESQNILGIIAQGDNGYQSLLAEARSQGGDDVMNIRVDTKVTNILSLYWKVETVLTGQAVSWK